MSEENFNLQLFLYAQKKKKKESKAFTFLLYGYFDTREETRFETF